MNRLTWEYNFEEKVLTNHFFFKSEKYICTKKLVILKILWGFSPVLVFSLTVFCLFCLFCLAFGCLDTDWALNGLPRVTDYPPLAPICCYRTIVSRILTLPNTNNDSNTQNANPTILIPWHQSAAIQLYYQVWRILILPNTITQYSQCQPNQYPPLAPICYSTIVPPSFNHQGYY